MNPLDLERLCADALARIRMTINYSVGQHLRRMKEGWLPAATRKTGEPT